MTLKHPYFYNTEKCLKPVLRNGYVSDGKVLYKIQESMRYGCTSGYKTTGGKNEEVVQCLPEGWSSPPSCRKEQGEHTIMLFPEVSIRSYEVMLSSRDSLICTIDLPLCLFYVRR